jgi:hypothetical protein
MTLREIETFVLVNIGHKRYSTMSAAGATSNDGKDFALLHRCVFLAREEIKLNTKIDGLLKRDEITTVANQVSYALATDFHVPVEGIYRTADAEHTLERVYPENLLQKLWGNSTTDTGTPSMYMLIGNTSDVMNVELYLIPDTAGHTAEFIYKPVLTNLTIATDEDLLMQKFSQTVIKLTTAFAQQLIKKNASEFNKWFSLGIADFSTINQREQAADSNYKVLPDSLTRRRRQGRFSR